MSFPPSCRQPGFGCVERAHLADDRIRPPAWPPAGDRFGHDPVGRQGATRTVRDDRFRRRFLSQARARFATDAGLLAWRRLATSSRYVTFRFQCRACPEGELFVTVADGLDVVAVGIEDVGAVIAGVVDRAQPGWAVIASSRSNRRGMERVNLLATVCC